VKYAHRCRGSSMRKHAAAKVKISEEMTRVGKFLFKIILCHCISI